MGFEDSEADEFIEKVPQLGLGGGAGNAAEVFQEDFLCDFSAFFLGLKQNDGADIVAVLGGKIMQMLPRQNAIPHGVFPAFMLGQADGKLNHLLRLEFRSGHVVQDVAVIGGGGGKFHHTSGVYALQHFETEGRRVVVRLVHDHQRPVQGKQVAE